MTFLRPLVVCSLLFSACGGRYDVGEEPNAESGGVGGSGAGGGGSSDTASGGASVSGGTGGASMTGGTGGTDVGSGGASAGVPGMGGASMSGGTGGVSMAGGVGGSDAVGGAGMMPATNFVCGVPEFDLEYGQFADQLTIHDRIARFFSNERVYTSFSEDPPTDRAAELTRALLADARSSGTAPAGLAEFMRGFMLDRIEGAMDELELGERWGGVLAGEATTLASLFMSEGSPRETFGIFTDAAQLWSEPSARGAWMADSLFCMPVTPEPPGGDPTPPPPAGTTRRDWVSGMVTQPTCAGCHSIIDPLGFSMEILAPETGEYRTVDNGLPIDASGLFTSSSGENFMFADIGMLSASLSTSCDVARCFVTHLFDRAVSISAIDGYEQSDVDWVLYQFARDESFTLEDALVSLVQTPAFLH